jgi:hypothetical protein
VPLPTGYLFPATTNFFEQPWKTCLAMPSSTHLEKTDPRIEFGVVHQPDGQTVYFV